jgi:ubiquinone/menaquinone biosynthesis C-methylase UbiE
MELRKVPYDSSNLRPEEVDLAIIIDTYHHIENRSNYFSEVREGLKQGGQLVVIDFKKEDAPVGPPVAMKMTADTIISELRQAGFNYFDIDRETLPYQYIIQATE